MPWDIPPGMEQADAVLEITVEKIKKRKGHLNVEVCSEEAYNKNSGKKNSQQQPEETINTSCITISEAVINRGAQKLPPLKLASGTWAVRLHQDYDGDERMDYNFLGLPKEPFGFYRIKRIPFSEPKFKRINLTVGVGEHAEITVRLIRF